jgi:hypothetical protein
MGDALVALAGSSHELDNRRHSAKNAIQIVRRVDCGRSVSINQLLRIALKLSR